jgi:hypothetical protein
MVRLLGEKLAPEPAPWGMSIVAPAALDVLDVPAAAEVVLVELLVFVVAVEELAVEMLVVDVELVPPVTVMVPCIQLE